MGACGLGPGRFAGFGIPGLLLAGAAACAPADRDDRILYHFPATLGADYALTASGEFVVRSIVFHPEWHYQPALLAGVDPDDDDAILPPGPNSAVGAVWMALSKPHYGIHGTSAPQTIGYATSSGCVRLTNWDAVFLALHIRDGVPVEFRDVRATIP